MSKPKFVPDSNKQLNERKTMKTWQNSDKSEWPLGEWHTEPDKAHWIEEGLDCLIVRNHIGALCGYVGVPEQHPCFGQDYDSVDVEVHGGLTFSDTCHPRESECRGICHPKEGAANETVWWLGFDCAHGGDIMPKLGSFGYGDTYRNFSYVRQEVASLAKQLNN